MIEFFFLSKIISLCSVRAIIKDANHGLLWTCAVYKIMSKSAGCWIYLVMIFNDLCFLHIANRHIKGGWNFWIRDIFFLLSLAQMRCTQWPDILTVLHFCKQPQIWALTELICHGLILFWSTMESFHVHPYVIWLDTMWNLHLMSCLFEHLSFAGRWLDVLSLFDSLLLCFKTTNKSECKTGLFLMNVSSPGEVMPSKPTMLHIVL